MGWHKIRREKVTIILIMVNFIYYNNNNNNTTISTVEVQFCFRKTLRHFEKRSSEIGLNWAYLLKSLRGNICQLAEEMADLPHIASMEVKYYI